METKVSIWIEQLESKGQLTFSIDQLRQEFSGKSDKALQQDLFRLVAKKKIQSVHRGFYTIVPLRYSNIGGLAPVLFINPLMEYLNRKYYISLLSAASFHGAAHQAPQMFYVMHSGPSLRKSNRPILPIQYLSRKNWFETGLIRKKTETGYVQVANPLLTALDLIENHKRVGGMNRVLAILEELAENCSWQEEIACHFPHTILRRLGFMLDIVHAEKLSNQIFQYIVESGRFSPKIFMRPANNGKSEVNNRWNIVENTALKLEE